MTRVFATLAALLLVGFAAINGTTTANSQSGDGWIQLFNGKDLDGWTPKITGHALGDNYGNTSASRTVP